MRSWVGRCLGLSALTRLKRNMAGSRERLIEELGSHTRSGRKSPWLPTSAHRANPLSLSLRDLPNALDAQLESPGQQEMSRSKSSERNTGSLTLGRSSGAS